MQRHCPPRMQYNPQLSRVGLGMASLVHTILEETTELRSSNNDGISLYPNSSSGAPLCFSATKSRWITKNLPFERVGQMERVAWKHMLSCFSRVQLFVMLWTVAEQGPRTKGFSRQEYWSRLPCPSPTYTLPYVKQIASGNLLYDAGNSNRFSVTTQRGGMGWEVGGRSETEGTQVFLRLIPADAWQKPAQYCKEIIL